MYQWDYRSSCRDPLPVVVERDATAQHAAEKATFLPPRTRKLPNSCVVWGGIASSLLVTFCLAGCARVTPQAAPAEVTRLILQRDDYDRLAYVKGEDCVGRYAIFFRFFSPNVIAAAGRALKEAPGANFFINRHVSMEERVWVPLLYHQVCAVVEGRAIRLHTAAEERP